MSPTLRWKVPWAQVVGHWHPGCNGFKAQLIDCIGGIRNKFPQKDFSLGVQGVYENIEQLLHLRLILVYLGLRRGLG